MDPQDGHDFDEMQVSDSLQQSIYSTHNNNPDPTSPTPAGQAYNPNQFQRTQSGFNNQLLNSHTDFTDIQTLEATDDGNWDETQQYRHDLKSYCKRYLKEAMIIGLALLFSFIFLIGFIISLLLHSVPATILCIIVSVLLGAVGGWFGFKFYSSYKKRTPFSFQG